MRTSGHTRRASEMLRSWTDDPICSFAGRTAAHLACLAGSEACATIHRSAGRLRASLWVRDGRGLFVRALAPLVVAVARFLAHPRSATLRRRFPRTPAHRAGSRRNRPPHGGRARHACAVGLVCQEIAPATTGSKIFAHGVAARRSRRGCTEANCLGAATQRRRTILAAIFGTTSSLRHDGIGFRSSAGEMRWSVACERRRVQRSMSGMPRLDLPGGEKHGAFRDVPAGEGPGQPLPGRPHPYGCVRRRRQHPPSRRRCCLPPTHPVYARGRVCSTKV